MDFRGPYRIGAFCAVIAAVLLVVALGMDLLAWAIALAHLALAWALMQGWRGMAYLAFFALFVAGIWAMGHVWGGGPLRMGLMSGVVAADWLGVVALFAALWKPRPEPAS